MNKDNLLTIPALLLSLVAAHGQPPQFTISTVAGNGVAGYSGDGGASLSAEMNSPRGLAMDVSGNIYIADLLNNRIRKVTPGGVISTVAGNGSPGFSGDGGPATKASLNQPIRVSLDSQGSIYIADSGNARIRKVTPDGTITTFAGNGSTTVSGDGGLAVNAGLAGAGDVKPDAGGNIFIAASNLVRKVNSAGIITTVAGNRDAGYSGDGGPATAATLNNANCVTVAPDATLYISDQFNNRIRKVAGGIITTVAGNGVMGFFGDGGPGTAAQLNNPACSALDALGNLYIADGSNHRIRVLSADGTITTIAGTGVAAFGGDGGAASNAALNEPKALFQSSVGAIYFADSGNNRIRVLTPVPQNPAITSGGVVSASAFGGFSSVAPGSWIEIYGANLASGTRSWGGADFHGINSPTSLDGTSVTIGGQSAFVDFISPGQVNALIPFNVSTGLQQITVTTPVGISTPFNITVKALQPGLLAPSSFSVNGTQYAVALFPDGTYVLPAGAIPGITSRPAKPGDTIVLYGVGFGPVTPSIPAGQLVQQANSLASGFQMFVGGMPATASYSGLAPNYTGLYQFNVVVPNVGASNAVPLTFMLGGANSTQTLYIAVQ